MPSRDMSSQSNVLLLLRRTMAGQFLKTTSTPRPSHLQPLGPVGVVPVKTQECEGRASLTPILGWTPSSERRSESRLNDWNERAVVRRGSLLTQEVVDILLHIPQGGRKCLYLAFSSPKLKIRLVSSAKRWAGGWERTVNWLVFSAGSYLSYSSCSSHITHITHTIHSGLRSRLLTRSRLLV